MELLQRYLPIVFASTILVLTIQKLAWAQGRREVEQAREEQRMASCLLTYNESLRGDFYYSIGSREETRLSRYTAGVGANLRCWSLTTCPGAPVSWCIYLYHPEKTIELCYNSTGHVTRETKAAAALRLDEKFQIIPELCPTRWPGCIYAPSPELFQTYAYLSCTAQTDNCYMRTFNVFEVFDSNEAEAFTPIVTFTDIPENSADVFLNETNLFQCNVTMASETYLRGVKAGWIINGVRLDRPIPQHPECELSPYVSSNSENCITMFWDTAMKKRTRVRFYSVQYIIDSCPYPTLMVTVWLLIEKASMADIAMKYECYGEYLFNNPVLTPVTTQRVLNVNPVYPLSELIPMDVPLVPANVSYYLEPNETIQWNCSVQAGLGDRLIWRLDGQELNHINIDDLNGSISTEDFTCSSLALAQARDSIVITNTKELGQYEKQFTSTLHICQATEFTAGIYECVVHRSRGDVRNVEVWSATVLYTASTTTATEPPKVHRITNHLLIIISVAMVTSSIVVVFIFVTMITLCVRCYRQRNKSNTHAVWELAMGSISVTDDILTEFRRKSSLIKDVTGSLSLEQNDPMEFPRNRLILLDRVLGEGTFGLVRQARAEGIVESTPERNIVAVKTTRAKAPPVENNNFWEELQLMKKMIPHANIVNLLGHCTTADGPIYMIIEYANHGSLRDFLKTCEEAVLKLNHIPQVQQSFRSCQTSLMNTGSSMYPHLVFKLPLSATDSILSAGGGTPTPLMPTTTSSKKFDFSYANYLVSKESLAKQDSGFFGENVDQAAFNDALSGSLLAHTVAPLTHDYVNTKGLIYMEDVQNFALQIACGLKHLEDIQIVHCDLAARNILIAEGFVLKIGDFGMARDVSEKEYYRKQGGRVPVKWTAPEALVEQIFTFKSDIWSFGVILWEIFTYGQQPYRRLKIRHSWEPFINYLMEGNRLEQPRGCPDSFYTLMKSCWHSSPDHRPSAEELVQILSQINPLYKEDTVSASDSGTQLSIRCLTGGYPQETHV